MSITLMQGFTLSVDQHHKTDNIIQDGLNSIGSLTDLSSTCSGVVAALNDGSIPNDKMVNQLSYAASTLSGIAQDLSNLIASIDLKTE